MHASVRLLVIDVDAPGSRCRIISVHAHTSHNLEERVSFFRLLRDFVFVLFYLWIGIDANARLDVLVSPSGASSRVVLAAQQFSNLLSDSELVATVHMPAFARSAACTWVSNSGAGDPRTLDYIFVKKDCAPFVLSSSVCMEVDNGHDVDDHFPLAANIGYSTSTRVPLGKKVLRVLRDQLSDKVSRRRLSRFPLKLLLPNGGRILMLTTLPFLVVFPGLFILLFLNPSVRIRNLTHQRSCLTLSSPVVSSNMRCVFCVGFPGLRT